jgi:hypothetical protein
MAARGIDAIAAREQLAHEFQANAAVAASDEYAHERLLFGNFLVVRSP